MTTATKERAHTNGSKESIALPSTQTGGPDANTAERRERSFPSLRTENPFVFMRRVAEELERLFEDFGGFRVKQPLRGEPMPRICDWAPEVEFFERDGKFIVRADLPGLKEDDVRVRVTAKSLTLSGQRNDDREEQREGYYRSERSYGSFFRRIPLPEGVNTDGAIATYTNGVLEVVMEAPNCATDGRQVEINDGAEEKDNPKSIVK